jgi:cyclopropane fatty-acyl-phospholipid synthase-like methyltransferase
MSMLLNALSALGLLKKDGEQYVNTESSSRYLVKDSPQYIGFMVMHLHHLVEAWAHLPQAVNLGGPVRKRMQYDDEERESFLMGMFNMAMGIAPRLAPMLDLKGRRHLLDMGGGPGTYAIHFCLENPDLRATVFDLPTTKPFARKTIERFGLSDRIEFVGGDYTDENIPGTYDVVWLSQVLHSEGPDACQDMIKKAASTLEKGGLIFVHDFILDDTRDSPLHAAIFSLNMLVNSAHGQSYSEGEIKEMLKEAGVQDVRRLDFRGPNDSGIIMGVA